MNQIVDSIIHFLGVVSLQIFILCVIAELFMRVLRVRHYSAYWVYGFIMLSPILSVVSIVVPYRFDISIPLYKSQQDDVPFNPANKMTYSYPMYAVEEIESATEKEMNKAETIQPARAHSISLSLPDRKTCLLSGWFLIAIGLTVYQASRLRLLFKAMMVLKPADDPRFIRNLRDCAKITGIKRLPRLIISDAIDSPIVFGMFTPAIIIPSRFMKEEESEDLHFALLHEMVHVRHGDHWMWLPEFLLRHLFFFHPCVYWISRKIREEMESRCDRKVVELTQKKTDYADFLLREIWIAGNSQINEFALPVHSGRNRTERRVRRIFTLRRITMKEKLRNQFTIAITIASLIGILFVSFNFEKTTAIAQNQENASGGIVNSVSSGNDATKEDIESNAIMENGKRVIPWAWKINEQGELSSIRVLIGEREGKEGVDFSFDPQTRILRFLKPEDCAASTQYMIGYESKRDLRASGHSGGQFGNHTDKTLLRHWMGMPDQGEATATALFLRKENDASIYFLSQEPVFLSLNALFIINSDHGVRYVAKNGWNYDSAKNLLAVQTAVDPEKDSIQVIGKPTALGKPQSSQEYYNEKFGSGVIDPCNEKEIKENGKRVIPWAWQLKDDCIPSTVHVLINQREAKEGVDFAVDKQTKILRFLKPENCMESTSVMLAYRHESSPQKPRISYFGNYFEDDILKQWMGLSELSGWDYGSAVFLRNEKEAGLFSFRSAFESVENVDLNTSYISPDGHPSAYRGSVVLRKECWEFNPEKNALTINIKEPVDYKNPAIQVMVKGKKSIPWKWYLPDTVELDSGKVLLGDRLGVRGVDYEINEKEKTLSFLKKELCTKEQKFIITFIYDTDSKKTQKIFEGNMNPRTDTVKRLLGLEVEPLKGGGMGYIRNVGIGGNNGSASGGSGFGGGGMIGGSGSGTHSATESISDSSVFSMTSYYSKTFDGTKEIGYGQNENIMQQIMDNGDILVPCTWEFDEEYEPGSMKVMIGTREGKEGIDYTIDKKNKILHIIKSVEGINPADYMICYTLKDPKKPSSASMGAGIGISVSRKAGSGGVMSASSAAFYGVEGHQTVAFGSDGMSSGSGMMGAGSGVASASGSAGGGFGGGGVMMRSAGAGIGNASVTAAKRWGKSGGGNGHGFSYVAGSGAGEMKGSAGGGMVGVGSRLISTIDPVNSSVMMGFICDGGVIGESHQIIENGKAVVPWAWQLSDDINLKSINVLFGATKGKEGADYVIDEEKKILRFLKESDCKETTEYEISYSLESTAQEQLKTKSINPNAIPSNAVQRLVSQWRGTALHKLFNNISDKNGRSAGSGGGMMGGVGGGMGGVGMMGAGGGMMGGAGGGMGGGMMMGGMGSGGSMMTYGSAMMGAGSGVMSATDPVSGGVMMGFGDGSGENVMGDAHQIMKNGKAVIPWAWQLSDDIDLKSINVLIGTTEGKEGADYVIDAEKKFLHFLKEADCKETTKYNISYSLKAHAQDQLRTKSTTFMAIPPDAKQRLVSQWRGSVLEFVCNMIDSASGTVSGGMTGMMGAGMGGGMSGGGYGMAVASMGGGGIMSASGTAGSGGYGMAMAGMGGGMGGGGMMGAGGGMSGGSMMGGAGGGMGGGMMGAGGGMMSATGTVGGGMGGGGGMMSAAVSGSSNAMAISMENNHPRMIKENGKRAIPWAWTLPDNVVFGSVKVLLNKRERKNGVDFAVDPEKKILRFLDEKECTSKADYLISYKFKPGSNRFLPNIDLPEKDRGISFGNGYEKQRYARRWVSVPEEGDNLVFLGQEDDRTAFFVSPVFKSISQVHAFQPSAPVNIVPDRFLRKSKWEYKPQKNTISIQSDFLQKDDILSVGGERVIPWQWAVPKGIDINAVKVIIGDRLGIKGVEYDINEQDRIVSFLKPELCTYNQKYLIYAPDPNHIMPDEGFVFGNIVMEDDELQKLLNSK